MEHQAQVHMFFFSSSALYMTYYKKRQEHHHYLQLHRHRHRHRHCRRCYLQQKLQRNCRWSAGIVLGSYIINLTSYLYNIYTIIISHHLLQLELKECTTCSIFHKKIFLSFLAVEGAGTAIVVPNSFRVCLLAIWSTFVIFWKTTHFTLLMPLFGLLTMPNRQILKLLNC